MMGEFGIVLTDNGFEEKAYLGTVQGHDKKADEKRIAELGAKFPLKQAKEMIGGE